MIVEVVSRWWPGPRRRQRFEGTPDRGRAGSFRIRRGVLPIAIQDPKGAPPL